MFIIVALNMEVGVVVVYNNLIEYFSYIMVIKLLIIK